MSNDAKYWAYRLVFAGILCVDTLLLFSMAGQAMIPDGNVVPWAVAFFICTIASIPLGFKFHLAKERRWRDSQRDMRQLEVEALAATAKKLKKQQ
jgi:hypothetical protein